MSLINQMLKDLEQRNTPAEELKPLVGEVRSVRDDPSSGNGLRIFLVLLLLALGGFAIWWKQQAPVAVAPVAALPPSTAQAVAPAAVPAPPPLPTAPEPASLAGNAPTPLRLPGLDIELRTAPSTAERPMAPEKKVEPVSTVVATESTKSMADEKPREKHVKAPSDLSIKSVTPQQKGENLYKQAVSLLQQGRVSEARDALSQSLAESPANHGARQMLAGLLVENRRSGEAVNLLQEGVKLAPDQTGFVMALARLQVDAGDRKAGLQTLEQSAKYAADDAEYNGFYAALLQREHRHDEAVTHYLTALRADPANTSWLVGVGISLQEQDRFADAREAFERARQVGQLSPEVSAFVEQRLRQMKGK